MAKRSPRLIFTEEERALPELERAVRKADRAAVKLERPTKIPENRKGQKSALWTPEGGRSCAQPGADKSVTPSVP